MDVGRALIGARPDPIIVTGTQTVKRIKNFGVCVESWTILTGSYSRRLLRVTMIVMMMKMMTALAELIKHRCIV